MGGRRNSIVLAGGCFWCLEAVFGRLRGVERVISGYTGGPVENPTYHEVCNGTTGHAEAVQIDFDPAVISLTELLEVFWQVHDPTTRNRQGADFGTQYRSAIFCADEGQRKVAEESKRAAEAAGLWPDPIVTEIVPVGPFFPAEKYHQDYYRQNSLQPYCRLVIDPKLKKLQTTFPARLKGPPG